jgi:hypothetical protein
LSIIITHCVTHPHHIYMYILLSYYIIYWVDKIYLF